MDTQELIEGFEELRRTAEFPVFYLTGQAGTGKTYNIKQAIEQDPKFAQLAASTGIAGVNLGATTINQVLKYFNTDSLYDNYQSGLLQKHLRLVRKFYRNLVIDEVSMIPYQQLDLICWGLDEINDDVDPVDRLGLILIGDFCLGFGTNVMMADGSLKVVEEIKEGDIVMGPDSRGRKVLRTTKGVDTLYRVNQTNGDSYVVNSKHPIVLRRSLDGKAKCDGRWPRYPDYADEITLTAPELLAKSDKFRSCFLGYKAGVIRFPPRASAPSLDPYFLGLWLGDGDKDSPRITTADPEIRDYLESLASVYGLQLVTSGWDRTKAVRIALSHGRDGGNSPNPLRTKLRELNLLNNKHIPAEYLYNTETCRLALLAGLLDSDGSFGGGRYTICSGIEILAHQIKQLADQLGFRASINKVANGYYKNNPTKDMWRVSIGGDTWRIPCQVQRKQSHPRSLGRTRLESKLSIEVIGQGLFAGFETDGDHLFLLGDGTVTHNCQLPPVPGDLKQNGRPVMTKDGQRTVKEPTPWAFKSELWSRFEQPGHMVKLEKIWRQSDPTFLQGINSIRRGVGTAGTGFLAAAGVEFARELDNEFDGTTIVGRNEEVDRINKIRLQKLPGNAYRLPSERWWASEVRGHKQPGEWQYIPERLELKIGAYVMVLANQKDPLTGELVVANGDCGWVREVAEIKTPIYDYDLDTTSDSDTTAVDSDTAVIVAPKIIGEQVSWLIKVELVRRPGELVTIPYITRMLESRYEPDEDLMRHPKFPRDESGQPCKVRNSMGRLVWCLGSINYFPLRLAYASTVHKCVSPDTLVFTKDKGMSRIEEVRDGMRIFTGNDLQPITDWVRTTQRAYRIVTQSGFELICGEDHPVLTESQGYVEASALTANDRVKLATSGAEHFAKFDRYVPTSMNVDIAWMLGVLVGDGSYNDRTEGQLHIANSDPFIQQELIKVFDSLGRKISIRSDQRGLHSTQKEFRSWLYGLGLDYVLANKKRIPWAVTTQKDLLCYFLQGLFDTDGSVSKSGVVFCTASKSLSLEVQVCLELLGIPTKRSEYAGARDPYYQIRISAEGIQAYKDLIGFSRPYKKAALAELQPNRIIRRRGEWDAIKEVTDLGIEIPMIDISVAEEHVFVANGIVTHNSQGLSLDRVQIDPRGHFMGQPGMAYVALSRGRSPQGIRIVGNAKLFAERVAVDPLVRRFI